MSFPRCESCKDSGVGWLGEIPSHWEVIPARRIFSERRDAALPGDEQLSATQRFGVIPQRLFIGMQEQKVVLALTGTDNFKRVQKDDFVISLRSFQGGIEWSSYSGCVSPAYTVLYSAVKIFPSYWAYTLKCSVYISALQTVTLGIRDGKNIGYSQFGGIEVPVPPISEQEAIAVFLDRETAKLDELIAEQEKLLALLAEKRQATISFAVTRGIDPGAPMKDSKVSWLGMVPAHWQILPFRFCVQYQEGPGIMADDFRDDGVPLLRVSGVQGRWATLDGCNYLDPKRVSVRWEHFKVEQGDLLVSASASMGTVCEVGPEVVGSVPYTGIIKLRGIDGVMLQDFLRHFVVSNPFIVQIDLLKAGATIQHYGPTHLSQMAIVSPPVEEQNKIASFLDRELIRLEDLRKEAESVIDLLRERRSALISAAVTGKIDVRGLVEPKEAA